MKRRFKIDQEKMPNLPGMMLVTVEALKALGRSATIQELDQKVIELEGVTDAEQSITMNGRENRKRVNYYLAWARTYLKRGNAVDNSARGVWALTESGEGISGLNETEAIHNQVNEEERDRSRDKRKTEKGETSLRIEPIDDEADSNDWKTLLLSVIGEMSPDGFERLSQRLLREAGFTRVEVLGKTGDGGIDGVGVLRVNLVSFKIFFQCKRWKGSVSPKEIRDFRGALQGRADKGLFITTGNFTGQASDEATRDGAIAIDLIDGDRLCDLLKENSLGVETEMKEMVHVRDEWFQGI